MKSKKLAILVILTLVAPMILSACGATPEPIIQTQVVEKVVTQIVEVAGTPQVKTVVETQVVEKVVTVCPASAPLVTIGVGSLTGTLSPVPSWPQKLSPQHSTPLVPVSAHAELLPTQIWVTVLPARAPVVLTATGSRALVFVPSPS